MARSNDPAELVALAREGDRGALARLISLVERGGDTARAVGRVTYPLGGTTTTIGLTGAPGAGKSTLTGALVSAMRAEDVDVAVLAIDPSSPFTGGAILGDRVRMQDHFLDDQVFIRSMATRGHLGGLALATPAAVRVFDAAGFDWVLVETVGVGQVEVDVAGAADTTVVVVNPGWGDSVQANKAGLLEVADLFVVNKADRPGVAEARRDLEQMLDLSSKRTWRPQVISTVAATGEGVGDLWAAIGEHRAHLVASGELETRRAQRRNEELRSIVTELLAVRIEAVWEAADAAALRERLASRQIDLWAAADALVEAHF